MHVGEKIAARRKQLGMTQTELASEVFATLHIEAAWESGEAVPDSQTFVRLADALGLPLSELMKEEEAPDWTIMDTMFSDTHMYTRMRTLAQSEKLTQTYRALAYARKMHAGETRKPNRLAGNRRVPYIVHPLMMACHAHALGIRDDSVLAVTMLHDVCEDCGILPEELPFPENIRHSVALLTKHKGQPTQAYYDGIMTESCASIVKALDRCNNVSTMAQCFSREKLIEYINETEEYVYPLMEHIKNEYLDYSDAIFVIKYQILSLIESLKAMILRAPVPAEAQGSGAGQDS